MIKFKASQKNGRELLGFGLTAKNVERLKLGHPIHLFGEQMGVPFDITIFYGEDEKTMAADFLKHGFIGPDTVIHDTSEKKERQ